MLCEFTLPSNPKQKIHLHEATVLDAMDFSGIDPEAEEEATTLFLERVQDQGEYYSDPKKWTGEDRRYALFQYHINTTKYKTLPLSYTCSICGEKHTVDIPLQRILETYKPIDGDNYREFPFNGHNVIVRPTNGEDLELIEKYRYDLNITESEADELNTTPEESKKLNEIIRKKRLRMNMFRVLSCIDMPYLGEKDTEKGRRPKVEDIIMAMPASEFREFFERVENALTELRHGLQTSYIEGRLYLEIPDVKCEKNPLLEGITVRYPFRPADFIPTI